MMFLSIFRDAPGAAATVILFVDDFQAPLGDVGETDVGGLDMFGTFGTCLA